MEYLPTFTSEFKPNVGKYIYHTWSIWALVIDQWKIEHN